MLIPLFCSIARKGIRELDTTEKENHHGEKDYASFFFFFLSPRCTTLCDECATSARKEFSDRNEAIKGDISSRFSQRDKSTGNDRDFREKKEKTTLLVLYPLCLSFYAAFSDPVPGFLFSFFFFLFRYADIPSSMEGR